MDLRDAMRRGRWGYDVFWLVLIGILLSVPFPWETHRGAARRRLTAWLRQMAGARVDFTVSTLIERKPVRLWKGTVVYRENRAHRIEMTRYTSDLPAEAVRWEGRLLTFWQQLPARLRAAVHIGWSRPVDVWEVRMQGAESWVRVSYPRTSWIAWIYIRFVDTDLPTEIRIVPRTGSPITVTLTVRVP